MMMRQIVSYIIVALTYFVFVSVDPAFGALNENSGLTKTISQYHDAQMTVEDLAFFLVTHNYNATPKEDHVQVTVDGTIYRAVPNRATGLAELTIIN